MSSRLLVWTDEAWQDYLYWQTQDKKTLKRINLLINDTKRSPFVSVHSRTSYPHYRSRDNLCTHLNRR
ncbi:MAG: type II toxin-antitoxin system YoeB family toxin, partial [Alishewanella aestuarii]